MSDAHPPDLAEVLAPLKGFQRDTVDYVFQRMYLDEAPTPRFLIADEVGLGKTLIARGVVARAIHHMWKDVERIDVIYVCSSIPIAMQNLQKLSLGGADHRAITSRLTLLPRELQGLAGRKTNFVAFTPSTSFDLKSKGGRMDERLVLHRLLLEAMEDRRDLHSGLRNLLQGGVGQARWRTAVAQRHEGVLDESLVARFRTAVRSDEREGLRDRLEAACQRFHRVRDKWPRDLETMRKGLIGDLRLLLARTCVDALEPDLIILDEFQRFRTLLRGDDEMSQLARAMWSYVAPEGHRARVLLLSATPYRMYSTDAEVGADDHYPDFIETTRFLMDGDEERVATFEGKLRTYRRAIHGALRGDAGDVRAARDAVQGELGRVMVRTERVSATEDRAAMIREPRTAARIGTSDLRQWMFIDELSRSVGARDVMSLWKSAPYLPQFMGPHYDLKRRLRRAAAESDVNDAVRAHRQTLLRWRKLHRFERVDPANGRLRVLMEQLLDDGQHELLWVPPTLPHWSLRGCFAGHEQFTKALVFSAWHVVPDVVSALLSYEAERRMLGDDAELRYKSLHEQRRGLLRFSRSEGQLRGMNTLALQFPSLTLADEIHPLASRAAGEDVFAAAEAAVEELLQSLDAGSGRPDPRWYWAAGALLDARRHPTQFLKRWTLAPPASPQAKHWDPDAGSGDDTRFDDHVAELRAIVEDPSELGAKPDDLVEVVTELALGGPAVLAARALRPAGATDEVRQLAAAQVAEGLRTLFNQPTAMAVVRRMHSDIPYWRSTLRYSIDGCLGAVLEEHFHQLHEQTAWQAPDPDEACLEIANRMGYAATIKVSRVSADRIQTGADGVRLSPMRIRTSFALRYGRLLNDQNTAVAREGAVRAAFNSPYRPFVLASTSVGQEGLDFHPWCHAIIHWNLPGNPVDLEQREGRVHRYKGHAVRKNVAARYGDEVVAGGRWQPGEDIWEALFTAAVQDRPKGSSDLVPWWLCEGDHKVQRIVPMLPYSREVEQLRNLKRDLVAYRLAFGQPRQEELLDLVQRSDVDLTTVDDWTLDLSPPETHLAVEENQEGEARGAHLLHDSFVEAATSEAPPAPQPQAPPKPELLDRDLPRVDSLDRVAEVVVRRAVEEPSDDAGSSDQHLFAHAALILGFVDRDGRPTPSGEALAELRPDDRMSRVAQAFAESRVGRAWMKWCGVQKLSEVDPRTAEDLLRHRSELDDGTTRRRAAALVRWWSELHGPDASVEQVAEPGSEVDEGQLPEPVREMVEDLSEDLREVEIELLRDDVRDYVETFARAAMDNELLPIGLAERIAETLDELLARCLELDPTERAYVVGAARYFVAEQDARPDLEGAVGLDDDAAVLEWVSARVAST